jgi:hypothetical protein
VACKLVHREDIANGSAFSTFIIRPKLSSLLRWGDAYGTPA